jgi:hypothetical protein
MFYSINGKPTQHATYRWESIWGSLLSMSQKKMQSMSSISLSKRQSKQFVVDCFVLSTSCCKRADKVLQENAGKTDNNERTIGTFK